MGSAELSSIVSNGSQCSKVFTLDSVDHEIAIVHIPTGGGKG